MKHFLLGTAGHVDHGKTSLIHALTQVDTDRLPEEKERGLSIDLGFAPMFLPGPSPQESLAVGIVDVPGHHKFLRNMIAGVGGFDAALLVVDPAEGVKPQTLEHLQILHLLETSRGLVVLSKADRNDEDTLELARWEIAEALAGTFLEGAEMVATSIHDPQSMETLKQSIFQLFRDAEPRAQSGVARLPVDRSFSKTGFGTVVTGSLWSGTLRVGAEVEIMPGAETGRIRGLQVHGESVDEAVAGQRVAVNVSGLERGELERGTTLVSPPSVLPRGERFAVSFRLGQSTPEFLQRKFRATFFQATGHGSVSVNLISDNDDDIEVYGQLTFAEETFLCRGDRFLLRDETDQRLLGGGTVLAIDERPFQRRQKKSWLRRYQNLAGGGQIGAVLQALQESGGFAKEATLRKALGWSPADWSAFQPTLLESGRVLSLAGDKVCDQVRFVEISEKLQSLLVKLQDAARWRPGWRREELGKLLDLRTGRDDGTNEVLEELVSRGILKRQGAVYSTLDHQPALSPELQTAADQTIELLNSEGFSPRDWEMALAKVLGQEFKNAPVIEEFLLGTGRVERISEKLVMAPEILERAREQLREKSGGSPFSASEARIFLDTSRKYIIPILEWMDKKGWTHRAGDQRVLQP